MFRKTNDQPTSQSKSFGHLKRLYVTIVVSILVFLVVQQWLLHLSVSENKAFARHINLAGKQRMLSQNISKLSLQYSMDTSYRAELLQSLKTWNQDYHDLLHGNTQRGIDSPANPDLLNKLQVVGDLHEKMSANINHLTTDASRSQAALNELLINEREFLPAMDRIVQAYQHDAERSSDRITYVEYTMSAIALVIIMLEMFFVFRPTRNIIVEQEQQLEEKIKNLTDSIKYAKKVQDSILPGHKRLTAHLPQSFVLYLPKDIVAGDFYWIEAIQLEVNNLKWESRVREMHASNSITGEQDENTSFVLFAVADCTGHGVPGAMVSIVCHHAIEKVVKEFGLIQPAHILDKVNELVRNTFNQGEQGVTDGMDISICCLNTANNQLDWAGANNPLWIIRKEREGTSLIELKPDKQPIGQYVTARPFTHHSIRLQKGDCIYLFSDGFSDQFGGTHGKKMTRMHMKKMLIDLHGEENMAIQRKQLRERFTEWKKDMEQIDDVCVMGIRV